MGVWDSAIQRASDSRAMPCLPEAISPLNQWRWDSESSELNGPFESAQPLLQLSDVDAFELRGRVARSCVGELLMDPPVVAWPADRPSGAQEVDEEEGHGAEEDADRDVDHPVIGKGLGRRSDARRGRSATGGVLRAHVIALVDAQPCLCRVDDSDQLMPVEQLGGLLGAVLVGLWPAWKPEPAKNEVDGTKAPRVLVGPRVASVGIDAADDRKPSA